MYDNEHYFNHVYTTASRDIVTTPRPLKGGAGRPPRQAQEPCGVCVQKNRKDENQHPHADTQAHTHKHVCVYMSALCFCWKVLLCVCDWCARVYAMSHNRQMAAEIVEKFGKLDAASRQALLDVLNK